MTVAIGMVCSDGVLVASDSQATSGQIASPGKKVKIIDGASAVWTAAGSVYVIEEVEIALSKKVETHLKNNGANKWKRGFLDPDESLVREDTGKVIMDTIRGCYGSIMPGMEPPEGHPHPFFSSFLLLGVAKNGDSFFLEFSGDGQVNSHTQRGFYALGSGGAFASVAMALMKHYIMGPAVPLDIGQKLAYRTIETTCEISAGHVSGPVQMAIADSNGVRIADDAELGDIGDSVRAWKELEKNTLHRSGEPRSGNSESEPGADIPTLE